MKKILFASTALIATAGIASAEFNIGGDARLGVVYTDNATGSTQSTKTRIEQRMRIVFTGIAETDAGVKLEARVRLESGEEGTTAAGATTPTVAATQINAINGTGPGPVGFAVSYEGLRLDVGAVSDVIDSGDHFSYGGTGVGLTGFIEQNDKSGLPTDGFSSTRKDHTNVKVLYRTGDFGVSASYSSTEPTTTAGANVDEWQIGAGYSFGAVSVGAAVGNTDGAAGDFWALGVNGTAGAFSYNVLVTDQDGLSDVAYGFSGSYAVSSATAIQFAYAGGGASGSDDFYGIGASHDLGGGVSLKGGVGDAGGTTMADLGVSFSF